MPTVPPCFAHDPDWLDGVTEIHLERGQTLLRWDTDLLDLNGGNLGTIISADDAFLVRFRLEFVGTLWRCVAGDWNFDVGFAVQGGGGQSFDLSEKLPADRLQVLGWKGCDTQCIEHKVIVPAGTIPAGRRTGTVYEVSGRFQLACCGKGAALVGYEANAEYQFYQP
jgi:hypothetical protein